MTLKDYLLRKSIDGSTIPIIDGPGKLELFLPMISGGTDGQKPVKFALGEGTEVSFNIRGIEFEDGSGNRWNIYGYVGSELFTGYFDTQTRKGTLHI